MLADDSPLRRLPEDLPPREFALWVAVGSSIETIQVAYEQLDHALAFLSDPARAGGSLDRRAVASVVLESWSIVDGANRLRLLLDHAPGIKKKDPQHQVLMRKLRPVQELRNPIQHLDGELANRAARNDIAPVWGTLAWVVIDTHGKSGAMHCLQPSQDQAATDIPFVNPAGRRATPDSVNFVTLSAYGHEVDLTDIAWSVTSYIPTLEEALTAKGFGARPFGAGIVLASAKITFGGSSR